jgi:hypothetical protein
MHGHVIVAVHRAPRTEEDGVVGERRGPTGLGLRRRALALAIVAVGVGCTVADPILTGMACDESHACPAPLVCLGNVCLADRPDASALREDAALPGADASTAGPDASALGQDDALPGHDASTAGPDASAPVCANDGGGGTPAYLLDYQTGNFSQWEEQHYFRSAQEAIVTSPARAGYPDTARFTVAPGDYTNGGTSAERGEVMASFAATGNPTQGQTMWYSWSTFVPNGTNVDSDAASPVGNGWLILTQWHGTADSGGGPNIAFLLTKGTSTPHLVLDTNGGSGNTRSEWVQSTAFPLGQWVDFAVGVTWGESSSVGRITAKINGTTWVDNVACANLYTAQSAYMKQGIYRSASHQTHTIYHTGTRVGPTEASVALCPP